MKILHAVEFYHPSVGGMQEVVKQLSERLVRLGHDVTVATSALPDRKNLVHNGVKIKEFAVAGNHVRGIHGDAAGYAQYLLESDFDIITNFAAQQWTTDVALPILDQIKGKKVFVPTGLGGLIVPAYREYYEKMRTWMKGYDINVFLSEDYLDNAFAKEIGINPDRMALIPNGAAADEFLAPDGSDIRRELAIPKDDFLILSVGSHTGAKGHKEAIRIFRAAKMKNATLLIVGNGHGLRSCRLSCAVKARLFGFAPARSSDRKQIVVKSLSRLETVAAYKAADLFLFPSNTECSPIVLFECMAAKTPFLTSDVGNAKEIVRWSGGGELLPTVRKKVLPWRRPGASLSTVRIKESTVMLENLHNDRNRREQMATAGFRAWQERFSWEKIAESYERIYKKLLTE